MKTVFTTTHKRSLPVPPPRPRAQAVTAPPAIPPWLLPPALSDALLSFVGEAGGDIEEIRLRAGRAASLTVGGRNLMTAVVLTGGELTAILTHM